MNEEVEITIRDFIENIRKNGLPQIRGNLFRFMGPPTKYDEMIYGNKVPSIVARDSDYLDEPVKIYAACAFGQGLINSNAIIDPAALSGFEKLLYDSTWHLNDNDGLDVEEIADRLTETYKDHLNESLFFLLFDYTEYLERE